MKGCVGVEGIFLGFSSNGNVRGQQDKAEGQNQDQVDQKEQTASVLGTQIRKAPDVSHAHSASRRGQDKTDGTTKAFFFFVHDRSILLYDNDMGADVPLFCWSVQCHLLYQIFFETKFLMFRFMKLLQSKISFCITFLMKIQYNETWVFFKLRKMDIWGKQAE